MSAGQPLTKRVDKPRVSVVVPTFNRANDLRRCLDSLCTQTVADFEVLICDDGSTDATAEVCLEYAPRLDLTYDFAENFGGPARPRNRGLALARAPFVAFLDSDDWWEPRKLEVSLGYLEEGADVVYHDLYFAASGLERHPWRRARTRAMPKPAFQDLLEHGNAITNSSVVARRSLLMEIGGFSEEKDLIAAEDYDAWVRLAKRTEKFVRIPQTLGFYWTGGGNISSPARTIRNLDALEKRFADGFSTFEGKRLPYWMRYARGMACYRLKFFESAKENLALVDWQGTPLPIYVRTRLLLLRLATSHGE